MKKLSSIMPARIGGECLCAIFLIVAFCSLQAENAPLPSLIPNEEFPALTPELKQEIAGRSPLKARVVADKEGAVRLQVDGKAEPFMVGGVKGMCSPEKMRIKVWKQGGYDVVFVFYDLASIGITLHSSYNRRFWEGHERYVPEEVENVLWRVVKVMPNARILLWLWIDAYPGWDNEHPGELIRNEQGLPLVAVDHYIRFGETADPKSKERLAWSMYSNVFRQEAGEALRRFVQAVDQSTPGKQVIGYVLGGGQDGQLYSWDAPNFYLSKNASAWTDYSAPSVQAWHQWLEARYGTPKALSKAWNQSIPAFDTATPPAASSLVGEAAYHDPLTERQQIDWLRFNAEGRADLSSYFAKIVRETSSRPTVIGVSAGDGGCRYGMTASGKLLRDPNVDLFFHQASYGEDIRLPGNPGGVNAMLASQALHKKLFLCDMDQRSWIIPEGNSFGSTSKASLGVISGNDRTVGRAQNIEELRAMWRRETARLWQNGAGPMFHALVNPATFEDPAIYEELKFLKKTADRIPVPSPSRVAGDVAVIYDERSVHYLRGALSERHCQWVDRQQHELNASGVVYRFYYADDFRDGLVPPAKLYLFTNIFEIDKPFRNALQKVKNNGATLVWLQGTGFAQRDRTSDTLSETTGITLKPFDATARQTELSSAPGLKPALFATEKLLQDTQAGLQVDDPKATPLAYYANTPKVAAAYRDHGNWHAIFIGEYVLSSALIHALALQSGAWCAAPDGNVVAAGDGWMSIHPLHDGPVTLRLREPASLQALWPETIVSPQAQTHTLNLKTGTTYLFQLR